MDSINVVNDTFLYAYCSIPLTAPIGYYDVEIIPYGATPIRGTDMVEVTLYQWAPQISLVDPNKAYQGDTLSVDIHGKNTQFTGSAATSIQLVQGWFTISPTGIKIVHDSLIVADFILAPNARLGLYTVEVNGTVHGDLVMPEGFEILISPTAPQIEYVMPAKGAIGETLAVLIKGKNTAFVGGNGPRVRFQSMQTNFMADSVGIDNDTMAYAFVTIPNTAPAGWYDVRIWRIPDGNLTLTQGFEVLQKAADPEIKSISPDNARRGDTLQMAIICGGTKLTEALFTNVFLTDPSNNKIVASQVIIVDDTIVNAVFEFPKTAYVGLWDISIETDLYGEIRTDDLFELKFSIGIIEDDNLQVKVYPNPASEYVYLDIDVQGDYWIQLYDLNGKLKLQTQNVKQINLNDFASGTYLLQIQTDNKQFTTLIIVK